MVKRFKFYDGRNPEYECRCGMDDSCADGEYILFTDHEATLRENEELKTELEKWTSGINQNRFVKQLSDENETLRKELEELKYVPGHHECPKCGFYQVSSVLHPNGISPNKETPQQCPNDGTEMMSVTWKKHSKNNYEGAYKQAERATIAEEKLSALQKKCEELESELKKVKGGL